MKAVIPGKKPGKNPVKASKPASKTFKDDFVFIVDATGSMGSSGKRDEAERGINNFLDDQASVEGNGTVTVVLFHSGLRGKMETLADKVGLKDIRLNRRNYRLGGMTPLYECATKVIENYESDSDSVTVIIATDGLENASDAAYTKERLASLIRTKEAKGWNFIFLGQDIDARAEGAKVGVKGGTTAQTTSYERALRRTSDKVKQFRATRNAERLVYTDADRAAMS